MKDQTVNTGTFLVSAAMMADLNAVLMKTVKADVLSYTDMAVLLEFDKLNKAGPESEDGACAVVPPQKMRKRVGDKVKVHLNQKIVINKRVAMDYINGIEGAEHPFNQAVAEAIKAKPVHVRSPGQDGTWCKGRLGFIDPTEAARYLAGDVSEIVVTRGKTDSRVMLAYFAIAPNNYLKDSPPIDEE